MQGEEEEESLADTTQIFVFELAGEEYALEIERAKEVIKADEKKINPVPNVPDYIRGITNIRGQVVPVIDLEPRFDLKENESKFIVVIEVNDASAGMLVDDVKEVLDVKKDRIKDSPSILEEEIHADYIKGVAVLDERLIIILDLENGLGEEEAMKINEIGEKMGEDEDEEDEEELTQEEIRKKAKERVKES
ncbi:MAG: chemotaxis protein CheW [Candidatus Nanohaloarchaea archaeon]